MLSIAVPMLLSIIVTSILHVFSGLSREHSNFVLAALCIIVTSVPLNNATNPPRLHNLTSDWPMDIRTALTLLNIDPELRQYICCPTCCSLYGPFLEQPSDYHGVPDSCSHRATPTSPPCGASLFQESKKQGVRIPSRRFSYQPLRSWLARFLSRADVMASLRQTPGPMTDTMYDIWDSSVLRQFKGPDGEAFFKSNPSNMEIHLAFSMFVDWFNPFGTKQSGKHVSFGAVYMVCLNLPVDLRYQLENVYLAGIIPGPHEPSSYHLNHVIRPLVDDLIDAWSPGFQLTHTAAHAFGCLVLCAVIPLVCDLLAVRKTAGFAGLGNLEGKYCSFCLQTAAGIANTDVSSWKRRTWKEHVAIAELWRDAESEGIREKIYAQFGIRWSELLHLTYWNPTRFTVIDSMHNFFAGDLQHHCRNVLGMSADAKPIDECRVQPHAPVEQERELDIAINAIKLGSLTGLNCVRRGYIVALAQANNVRPKTNVSRNPLERLRKKDQVIGKSAYAKALLDWVSRQVSRTIT